MAGWLRVCWWGLAVVGGGAAVGLVVWVSVGHPEGSDQGWGIAGSVAAFVALGVGLWQLKRSAPARGSATGGPLPVTADSGSVAAAGSIRNADGRDTAPGTGTGAGPAGGTGISATGGSIAAGGDIDGASAHRGP